MGSMKAKMVKALQIHESRDEDDGLVLRAALAVIVAALVDLCLPQRV